jgi:hypothetical protein
MSDHLSFRCKSCNARLKAAFRHVGRSFDCPSCHAVVRVPPSVPDEVEVLVFEDPNFAPPQPAIVTR